MKSTLLTFCSITIALLAGRAEPLLTLAADSAPAFSCHATVSSANWLPHLAGWRFYLVAASNEHIARFEPTVLASDSAAALSIHKMTPGTTAQATTPPIALQPGEYTFRFCYQLTGSAVGSIHLVLHDRIEEEGLTFAPNSEPTNLGFDLGYASVEARFFLGEGGSVWGEREITFSLQESNSVHFVLSTHAREHGDAMHFDQISLESSSSYTASR